MAAMTRQTRRGTPFQLGGLFLPTCDSGDRWMPSGGVLAMPFKFQSDWTYKYVGFVHFRLVVSHFLSTVKVWLENQQSQMLLFSSNCERLSKQRAKDDGSSGSYLFSLLFESIVSPQEHWDVYNTKQLTQNNTSLIHTVYIHHHWLTKSFSVLNIATISKNVTFVTLSLFAMI